MSKAPRVDKKALAFDIKVQRLIKLYRLVQKGQQEDALALVKEMGCEARREAVAYNERVRRKRTIG